MDDASFCPSFGESWINEPGHRRHRVLGRRLRPLCHWHLFLLGEIRSPLLQPGAAPTLTDVEAAVRVCRSRYRDPVSRILPPPPRRRLARWWQKVRVAWVAARYPLPGALAAFNRYVRDYHAPPEFWNKASPGESEVGNPFPESLAIATQLIASGTFGPDNEAAVWEMPVGKARWYAAAFAKREGADLRLRTESDQEIKAMADATAKYEAFRKTPQYAVWLAAQQKGRQTTAGPQNPKS